MIRTLPIFLVTFFSLIFFSISKAQLPLKPGDGLISKRYFIKDSCTINLYSASFGDKAPVAVMDQVISVDSIRKQMILCKKTKFRNSSKYISIDSVTVRLPDFLPVYATYRKPGDITILEFNGTHIEGNWKLQTQNLDFSDSLSFPAFHYDFFPVLIGWLPLKQGQFYQITAYKFVPGRNDNLISIIIKYEGLSDFGGKKVRMIAASELSGKKNNYKFYIDANSGRMLRCDIINEETELRMERMQ